MQENYFVKLLENPSDVIALGSLMIALLALLVTIIGNYTSKKRYITSLDPALSFELKEFGHSLFLAVTNTGNSAAINVKINLMDIYNNGERNEINADDLFENKFMIYPGEKIQGRVAFSGGNLQEYVFPIINIHVSYIKKNTGKVETYTRTVMFSNEFHEILDLNNIEEGIMSLAYSNSRLTNYNLFFR